MTTSTKATIAQLKQSIQAIAEELGVVEDWANGHRGHRETWLNAYAKAQAAQLEFRAAQAAAKEIETEVELTEIEQETFQTSLTIQTEAAKVNIETKKEDGIMEILNKQALANSLANEIAENSGFSLWFDSEPRSSGYSVGNNTFSYQIPNVGNGVGGFQTFEYYDIVTEALTLFMAHVETLVNSHIYDCDGIGGWLDEETSTLYLDPVRHVEDLGAALEMALVNKELAIYDIGKSECLNVYPMDSDRITYEMQVSDCPDLMTDKNFWYLVRTEDGLIDGYIANDQNKCQRDAHTLAK